MSNPLVSVIIPVFNGTNYLREAIDSVLSQTYSNIELIVVDDGSHDSTWEMIGAYGSKIHGFHKENGGVASALNYGIKNSHGKYIAWLSHDDIFLPQKIELQINFFLMHPEYDICYTDFVVMDVQGKLIHTYHLPWYPRQDIPYQFLRNMFINGSTTLIKKDLFGIVGTFNEQRSFTQDMDMWVRISEYSEFGHLPEVLLQSRSHPEQGSWNFEIQICEEKSFFTEMFQRLGPLRVFPELANKQGDCDPMASGLEKLGDEAWKCRHWYSFAQEQYQKSLSISPSKRLQLKIIAARVVVALLGSENDSLLLVRRARFLLSQGNRRTARTLSATMLQKHPLRLDAFLIWFASFFSPNLQKILRNIKRSIMSS